MELHMHTHHLESRAPDWMAAVVAGFVSGAVVMVLELLWSALIGRSSPWAISHMVSAIVMGPDVLQSSDFSVAVVATALVTHYVLGIVFGLVLCGIIAPFHFDSSRAMILATGAVFGLLLYAFNFYGMSRIFIWFTDMRGWPALITHVIFGMVSAGAYWTLERGNRRL
ncbi:hypothetical protein [Glaciimonas sp. PAMC28666]|uniref:hypothetical protein n=1 Tax=Glaciimonas sp. PAMC28666 TaxID=2807626 RepID=UPI001965493F|nr:hypothetical protein [Glaciimonas sp. PAMC28666]QRX82899.1 hypothetical protein JQN73_00885 [Glaciimonas sp. PAMC28666]